MAQKIYEIKKFEDIIFKKREHSNTYHACLDDENDKTLLSIIYGENAWSGAQHGLSRIACKMSDYELKDDMNYEIMDYIVNNFEMDYDGGDNCYVISKEDLMKKILDSAKYRYEFNVNEENYHNEFVQTRVITKTITKIERKGEIE